MLISLFASVSFLLLASILLLSSISLHLFSIQLLWVFIGIIIIVFFYFVDWRVFFHYRWFVPVFYLFSLILLAITFVSPVIRNTKSWIVLGPFTFQPVEIAKVSLIVSFAYYFSRRHIAVARFSNILISFLILFPPLLLTLLQPDLGSASILFGIWFGFLSISGLPRRYFVIAAVFAIIGGALLWQFGLKPYQKDRIVGVFYPEKNALTVNYSVIQSRIAIGSAGFWGKGYHQGTQTQLGFLSEPANDFALSAFIEEWGWSSGLLIISALLLLEFSVLRIGMRARRNVEKFICIGTAMMWIMQFFINAGSATGLFPVVGVTFPFLSYGGSSLLANFLLFGLIFSIYKHQ